MFRTIASGIQYPLWAGTADKPVRWRRLDQLDRMLAGTFYDHLQYSFYDERSMMGERIRLHERRPSSRFNLPAMVAKWSMRKLWMGRHVPTFSHDDDAVVKAMDQVISTTQFMTVMGDATFKGSVGSVAVVFRIDRTSGEPLVSLKVWRARDCWPEFDDFNNLRRLLVHYNVSGRELLQARIDPPFTHSCDGDPIKPELEYWFIKSHETMGEIIYSPVRVEDFCPPLGWVNPERSPQIPHKVTPHGLGFVPAVWIRNMSPHNDVDGSGTWEVAKDTSIEIDYLMSQSARGVRYNCSPMPVFTGEFADDGPEVAGSADYVHMQGSRKTEDGTTTGDGRAELLEMSGGGMKIALELLDKLRNMALESAGATRKDPEKLKGVMSGRAMEFMDEDSHDLIMELRTSYGVNGSLELMRKILRALGSEHDPKGVRMDWPRLYQPTPEDLAHPIPALAIAVTPIQEPLTPEEAAKISGGADGVTAGETTKSGGGQQQKTAHTVTNKSATGASTTTKHEVTKGPGTQGGRPSAQPDGGKIIGSLLEMEEASRFLKLYMDIDLLPKAEDRGVSDSDEPTDSAPRPEPLDTAPEEASTGEGVTAEPNPLDAGMGA